MPLTVAFVALQDIDLGECVVPEGSKGTIMGPAAARNVLFRLEDLRDSKLPFGAMPLYDLERFRQGTDYKLVPAY
jgi:hypothetical protein